MAQIGINNFPIHPYSTPLPPQKKHWVGVQRFARGDQKCIPFTIPYTFHETWYLR